MTEAQLYSNDLTTLQYSIMIPDLPNNPYVLKYANQHYTYNGAGLQTSGNLQYLVYQQQSYQDFDHTGPDS